MDTNTQQNGIAVYGQSDIEAFVQNEAVIKRFVRVLGSTRYAQSFIASALLAVANNEKLMKCEPGTVWSSALRIATLGLSCDPTLAQAHLVPFNNWRNKRVECSVILGWRGVKQIAMKTGKYRFINSRELYEGQIWDEDQLTGAATIRGQRSSDKIIGYFNFFELYSGYSHGLYMTVEQLHAHGKRYSKTYNDKDRDGVLTSKWHTDFEFMALKTVTRLNLLRHGYMIPADRGVLEAMGDDDGADDQALAGNDFADVEPEPAAAAEPTPVKPKKTEAELQRELGFEDPAPKPKSDLVYRIPNEQELRISRNMRTPNGTQFGELGVAQLEALISAFNRALKGETRLAQTDISDIPDLLQSAQDCWVALQPGFSLK